MATFSSVTRQNLLQAIEEYDRRGREDFLGVYGLDSTPGYTVVHDGRSYELGPILGVAHRYATGRIVLPNELNPGALAGTAPLMRKRGFEVHIPTSPSRSAAAARTTGTTRSSTARATATRRTATPERVDAICPTCSMTLPATGICDNCS